jgi:hypothetical protein
MARAASAKLAARSTFSQVYVSCFTLACVARRHLSAPDVLSMIFSENRLPLFGIML